VRSKTVGGNPRPPGFGRRLTFRATTSRMACSEFEGTAAMRAVIQRVSQGKVSVEGQVLGEIGLGLVILLGVGHGDGASDAESMASKIANLRIFSDAEGKTNLSLLDVQGEALVISQFTLYADCRRGRRPGFTNAALPDIAAPLVVGCTP
jgi:D-aminoacyl-tRNA deacylase